MRGILTLGMMLALPLWLGCDAIDADNANAVRLTLDFSSNYDAYGNAVLDGCATSIETVVLNVNGREFREDVTDDTTIFEVTGLRRGVIQAEAVVLSNTGDTLFVGEDRRTSDGADFGTVDIRLEKVRSVLQICPDTLILSRDNNYVGTLSIWNRGSQSTGTPADTLFWRAVESPVCINDRCMFVTEDSGMVVVPRPYLVFVEGFAPAETVFPIEFASPFGRAQIYARVVVPSGNG